MNNTTNRTLELGVVVMTPGAAEEFSLLERLDALDRHNRCDWGDTTEYDAQLNNESLTDGSRIVSVYNYGSRTLWIITEAEDDCGHRAATTLLLPEEY